MSSKLKHKAQLAIAFLCGAFLFSAAGAYAATEIIAKQSSYKVKVDGIEQKLSNKPVTINGSAYLPVREVASITGYDVKFDGKSGTINLLGEGYVESSAEKTSNPNKDGVYVKNLSTKYNNDKDQLDASLLKEAIKSGELNVNAQDQDTGESLFHLVIKQNNFPAYEVIKANKINPSLKDNEGLTPLHVAVIEENSFYYGELKNEFNVKQHKDNSGKYPIDYAGGVSSTFHRSLLHVDKAE